jgi:hypothetical protein
MASLTPEPDDISDTFKKAKNRGRWLSIVAVNGHSPYQASLRERPSP